MHLIIVYLKFLFLAKGGVVIGHWSLVIGY